MATMFDSCKASETILEKTSHSIATSLKKADACSHHIEFIMELLGAEEPMDYHNLRDKLDKYSIFRGRNPKVS